MLASQAFELQKSLTTEMLTLKTLRTQQTDKVNSLKYQLIKLENNIAEVKTEKYAYHTFKSVIKSTKEAQKIINRVYSKNTLEVLDLTKEFLLNLEDLKNL